MIIYCPDGRRHWNFPGSPSFFSSIHQPYLGIVFSCLSLPPQTQNVATQTTDQCLGSTILFVVLIVLWGWCMRACTCAHTRMHVRVCSLTQATNSSHSQLVPECESLGSDGKQGLASCQLHVIIPQILPRSDTGKSLPSQASSCPLHTYTNTHPTHNPYLLWHLYVPHPHTHTHAPYDLILALMSIPPYHNSEFQPGGEILTLKFRS